LQKAAETREQGHFWGHTFKLEIGYCIKSEVEPNRFSLAVAFRLKKPRRIGVRRFAAVMVLPSAAMRQPLRHLAEKSRPVGGI